MQWWKLSDIIKDIIVSLLMSDNFHYNNIIISIYLFQYNNIMICQNLHVNQTNKQLHDLNFNCHTVDVISLIKSIENIKPPFIYSIVQLVLVFVVLTISGCTVAPLNCIMSLHLSASSLNHLAKFGCVHSDLYCFTARKLSNVTSKTMLEFMPQGNQMNPNNISFLYHNLLIGDGQFTPTSDTV
jgi:hypothetical protein